jgi:hypothetical protein
LFNYSDLTYEKTNCILDEHTAAHVAEYRSFSDTSQVRILSAIIERK